MKRAKTLLSMTLGLIGTALASVLPAAQAGGEKVPICHRPGTAAEKKLLVPPSAVAGHLAHGDTEGSCDDGSGKAL